MNKYYGELLLFIVTILASLGWLFSKFAIAELPPVGFLGLRFCIATLLFLPFAYSQLKQLKRTELVRAGAVGFCFTFHLFFWVMGINYSESLGEGAFIMSLSMLIAPIIAWLIFKYKPATIFWLSFIIALIGLYLLATDKAELHFTLGSIFFLLSSLCTATYFVLNNQYAKHIPPFPLTVIQLGTVGTFCIVYSALFEVWQTPIADSAWLWLAASIFIATNFRYVLQTLGQKHCNVVNAAIIMMFEPIWTSILSVLILGEDFTAQKIIGCTFILTALFVYRLQNLFKKN